MWIKRQEGYCLKEIAGVHYLLPYGQKVADQRKGIVLNETGVFLWNAYRAENIQKINNIDRRKRT